MKWNTFMVKSLITNKKYSWKRSLTGGCISALVGGVCFSLFLFQAGFRSVSGVSSLLPGFGFPAFIHPESGIAAGIVKVTVFWFFAGAGICYFIRKISLQ
jgi:hypothetical protein